WLPLFGVSIPTPQSDGRRRTILFEVRVGFLCASCLMWIGNMVFLGSQATLLMVPCAVWLEFVFFRKLYKPKTFGVAILTPQLIRPLIKFRFISLYDESAYLKLFGVSPS